MTKLTSLLADPGGRSVKGVGLRPLDCWDCGFQSGAVIFVCSVCRVARQRPLQRAGHLFRGVLARVCVCVCVCVIVCDLETSTTWWPTPELGCGVTKKKKERKKKSHYSQLLMRCTIYLVTRMRAATDMP